jgi:hypothetical protein
VQLGSKTASGTVFRKSLRSIGQSPPHRVVIHTLSPLLF